MTQQWGVYIKKTGGYTARRDTGNEGLWCLVPLNRGRTFAKHLAEQFHKEWLELREERRAARRRK